MDQLISLGDCKVLNWVLHSLRLYTLWTHLSEAKIQRITCFLTLLFVCIAGSKLAPILLLFHPYILSTCYEFECLSNCAVFARWHFVFIALCVPGTRAKESETALIEPSCINKGWMNERLAKFKQNSVLKVQDSDHMLSSQKYRDLTLAHKFTTVLLITTYTVYWINESRVCKHFYLF